MHFLIKHLWIVLFSAAAAYVLHRWEKRFEPLSAAWTRWAETRAAHRFVPWIGVALYMAFYLSRPVFYVGYHGGSLGDCYNYLRQAMIDPYYAYPHHFFFAFVPMRLLHLLMSLGFYSRTDTYYLEKVYRFCSLPGRLAAFLGLAAAYASFRLLRFNRLASWLGTFFLGVSFGYWFWPLQCNAMGTLLPLMACVIYTASLALVQKRSDLFVSAGILTSLCLFTHISSLYFTISVGVVMSIAGVRQPRLLASFLAACLVMGSLYYVLSGYVFRTYTPSGIMHEMSYAWLLGDFTLGVETLKRLFQDSISVPLTLMLGLLQTGEKTPLELVFIGIELTSLLWVLYSIRSIRFRLLFHDARYAPLWFSGAGFLACVIGFSLRKTWLQYYAPVAPCAALTFIGLAFCPRTDGKESANYLPVALLAISMFFINGMSSTRVFWGEHPQDLNVYRTLTAIHETVGTQDAIYYGDKLQDWYNFNCVFGYYRCSPRFVHLLWRKPVPLDQIKLQNHSSRKLILLSAADYPDLRILKNTPWTVKLHVVQDPRTPSFYILTPS